MLDGMIPTFTFRTKIGYLARPGLPSESQPAPAEADRVVGLAVEQG